MLQSLVDISCTKTDESPKWFSTDHDIKICDVVLFLKQDWVLNNNYQYGMVNETVRSKDGIVRKVIVQYRNHEENIDRYTTSTAVVDPWFLKVEVAD